MQSGHLIAQTEFAKQRSDELLRQAARRRLILTVTESQGRKTALRHRLGNLLVRSGERLQKVGRVQPVDDFGTSAGVLHLAR